MPYAKPSTPTNIAHSNPPNQLPTYHFTSFLITAHTQQPSASCQTLYAAFPPFSFPPSLHAMHSAPAAKSNVVFCICTHMRLILHLCVPSVCQYSLNATHPSMNQQTVSSLHYRARIRVHRFLKRTIKYLLNHKMKHCSTYTPPDLPPTLPASLALSKGIH